MNKIKIIVLLFLVSCSRSSTDEMLRNAIRKIEATDLTNNGHIIESMKIDSLDYTLQSIKNFYEDQSMHYGENLLEMKKGNEQMVERNKSLKQLIPNTEDIEEDSNYYKNLKITEQTEKKYFSYLNLALTADTSIKIFVINYSLKAKTNKNSYDQKKTKYLFAKDFKEIK